MISRLLPADGIVAFVAQATVDVIPVNRAWSSLAEHFMNSRASGSRCGAARCTGCRAPGCMTENRAACRPSRCANCRSGTRAHSSAFQSFATLASGPYIVLRLPHAFIDVPFSGARAYAL